MATLERQSSTADAIEGVDDLEELLEMCHEEGLDLEEAGVDDEDLAAIKVALIDHFDAQRFTQPEPDLALEPADADVDSDLDSGSGWSDEDDDVAALSSGMDETQAERNKRELEELKAGGVLACRARPLSDHENLQGQT